MKDWLFIFCLRRIALYDENKTESEKLNRYLEQCGREMMRIVNVTVFGEYEDFCRAVTGSGGQFELLVMAQNGTFSLEIIEMARANIPDIGILWFSDLDFSIRSYAYGVLWFGRKPVQMEDMRKAFRRMEESQKRRYQ